MTGNRFTAEAWCALLATDSRYTSSSNPTPTESKKQNTHANSGQPSAREGGGLFLNQYIFPLKELMVCPKHFQVFIFFFMFMCGNFSASVRFL